MKRMKRVVAIAAAAAMTASVMTGCGKSGGNEPAANHGGASGEVVSVDFWTAPQQVQYNFWESKAQAFNEAGITVDGKKIADAGIHVFRSRNSECNRNRDRTGCIGKYQQGIRSNSGSFRSSL